MKTKKNKHGVATLRLAIGLVILTGLILSVRLMVRAQAVRQLDSTDEKLMSGHYFEEPLIWVGSDETDKNESLLLLSILESQPQRGTDQTVYDLEEFLNSATNSPWTASLHCNLGYYYRTRGAYTRALEHWRLAWAETREIESGPGRRVADFTSINFAKLLSSLGRVEELEQIFVESKGRRMSLLSWQHKWVKSQEALLTMKEHPEISYRCGTLALLRIGRSLGVKTLGSGSIAEIASPGTGFSIAALLEVAKSNSIPVVAVQRSSGEELIVPSVIHWKQNHYAAIVERRGDLYLVEDPTFGLSQWLRGSVINEEASGYFLVSPNQIPSGYRRITQQEAQLVYGKGMNADDPPPSPPPCPEDGQDECDCASQGSGPSGSSGGGLGGISFGCSGGCSVAIAAGMPVWEVKEPYISLWLHDEPMSYKSALGGEVALRFDYHQRETRPADGNVFNFGPYWNCNWLSYLDISDYADDSQLDYYNVSLFGSRGGERHYDYANTDPEYRSRTQFERIFDGSSNLTGFRVTFPNGGEIIYGLRVQVSSTPLRILAFPTQRIDPQGHATQFTYSTNGGLVLLTQVTDADGRATALHYSSTFPTEVDQITSPDSSVVQLRYNEIGLLTNIVDVAGIGSSFEYTETDGIYVMSKLKTPYGDTLFDYLRPTAPLYGDSADDNINRAITVTQPDGGKHLFMYRDDCFYLNRSSLDFLTYCYSDRPTDLPVGGSCDDDSISPYPDLCNHNMYYRNSFHWGPAQYEALSTTTLTELSTNDYRLGRLCNWLHANTYALSASETLNFQREPTPNGIEEGQGTWFGYKGRSQSYHFEGTNSRPSYVARVLPNGETQFRYREYNSLGHVTLDVSSWSDVSGPSTRTNTLVYANNGIDLILITNAEGVLISRNYFNNYHQVTTNYDALNQETTYTYDPTTLQLTSVTRPTGLVTTNIYDPSSHRLLTTIDLQINRTNSYTWKSSGDIQTHTDERNLSVMYYWDELHRLTGTSFPDGTSTTNLYTRAGTKILDLTATKDRMGFWTYFGYDGIRRKIAETNANGVVTRWGYCSCGTVSSVTNAWNTSEQLITTYDLDFQGRVTITHLPDATSTNWYDPPGRVIVTGGDWGYRWFGYNNQGLLIGITNDFGTERRTIYDIEDHQIFLTDANGITITNTYDDLGRLRTRGYPDGGVEKFGYSARGLTAYTNQLNFVTFYAYDEGMRKTFETNANLEVLRYTNNAASDLLSLTDGKNQTTRWKYDEYGRVTNKVDQVNAEILRYTYDPNNRLTNRWSVAKGNTSYNYDAVGNLTFVNYPASPDVTFSYDSLNRVTNMVDAAGTTKYTYTAGGQLFTEDGPLSSDTMTNLYTHRLRTGLGLQQPTSYWTNGFGYDSAKHLTSVVSPAGTFSYTLGATAPASALIKKLLLPNTSYITNGYDSNARQLFTQLKKSDNSLLDSDWYLYNMGNQRTVVQLQLTNYVFYRYDNIGQLTVADSTVNTEDRGYTYDAAWNLSSRTNNGTTQPFSVDGLNQLVTDPSYYDYYDANGNLEWQLWGSDPWYWGSAQWVYKYVYDDENRLTSLTFYDYSQTPVWATGFIYDGIGRMRKRVEYSSYDSESHQWQASSETRYIYDGKRVIQERDGNNTPTVSYTRGTDLSGTLERAGGIGGLLARSHGYSSGNWSTHNFYHSDGNGNITYLVNSSQSLAASYKYDPYGNLLSSSGTLASANTYRFSSKEIHANSGLYYYLYRFYDPATQRWANRDPIAELGFELLRVRRRSLFFLQSLQTGESLYSFVHNDPVMNFDPYGLSAASDCYNDCANESAERVASCKKAACVGAKVGAIGGAVVLGLVGAKGGPISTIIGAVIGAAGGGASAGGLTYLGCIGWAAHQEATCNLSCFIAFGL